MHWQKQGLIYAPSGERWWAKSYAHLPTADVINDKIIRVYFAALDAQKYGRIGYVDLDANNPQRILRVAQEPVLGLGELGLFDDSGVNPSCMVTVGTRKYLYYIGWQRCTRVPYMLFTGLAISEDGELFTKVARVPVLDRTVREPFIRSATTILIEEDRWRAWYVSGLGWTRVNNVQYPTYVIRHAESANGLVWTSSEDICINLADTDEFGFGRPWVVKDGAVYRMWYSIRSRSRPYRIGYAESTDGIHWARQDAQVSIEKSATGWDSEMICYPCVIDVHGSRLMFYNGNRHGESGFGYAIQVMDE